MQSDALLRSLVLPLNAIYSYSADLVGGKASQLVFLRQLGLNVAPGVAVLAAAHDYAESLSDETSRLQYARDIADLVRETLRENGAATAVNTNLLVRSSAVNEDSRSASYAGQFESVKCSSADESLPDAIIAVWLSVRSDRVASYATSRHEERASVARMALLIQPYLNFSYSGVLFSRHPVVPLPGWMYVECLEGQPEKLVAGESSPTRLRIHKSTLRIVSEYGDESILRPSVCAELLNGAERITQHLGFEVDIEWGATSQDELFWLQCRPLTT